MFFIPFFLPLCIKKMNIKTAASGCILTLFFSFLLYGQKSVRPVFAGGFSSDLSQVPTRARPIFGGSAAQAGN